MTIRDLASKIQGNVLITVMTSDAIGLYDKDGKLDAVSSAHELSDNTLIEFQSQYWDKIKDDVIEMDVSGLRMVGYDRSNRHPGVIVYVDVCHDDEPITEELFVETEAELIDAMQDDSFDRIRLACDIKLANKLAVYDTTKTLDLAGHTLSIDDWNAPVIQVGEDAKLTITGNGVVYTQHSDDAAAVGVFDGGMVTIDDGAFICGTGSVLSDEITCLLFVRRGKMIINGGAFSNSDMNGILLNADGADAIIECRGGKFIGADPTEYAAAGCAVNLDNVDGVPVYTVVAQQ